MISPFQARDLLAHFARKHDSFHNLIEQSLPALHFAPFTGSRTTILDLYHTHIHRHRCNFIKAFSNDVGILALMRCLVLGEWGVSKVRE